MKTSQRCESLKTESKNKLTMQGVHRMSMENLKKCLVDIVTKHNLHLQRTILSLHDTVPVKIITASGTIALTINTGVNLDKRAQGLGVFYRDTRDSPWGLFVKNDGYRQRMLYSAVMPVKNTVEPFECETTNSEINSEWMQHVWERVNAEVRRRAGTNYGVTETTTDEIVPGTRGALISTDAQPRRRRRGARTRA